jgi:putative peptidoglycan lipid II flippase
MSTKSVAKAAGFIAIASILSRALGFLRESIIAGYFGKTWVTDAYMTGFVVPDLFYSLIVAGALTSAFMPVLTGYIAKGKQEEAWEVASSFMNLIFVTLGVLIMLGLAFAPDIINIYIPYASVEAKQLATDLTRILLLQPLLLSISGFAMGILNSLKIFGPSAIGSVVYAAGVILGGVVLRPYLGIKGFAIGVLLGSLGNFLVQVPALRRTGFRYRLVLNLKHPGVRRIATLALPIVLSFTLNQIMVLVNQNLNSGLPQGSLSALMYAYRLQQVPIGIFAVSIGTAVFPTLTEFAARKEYIKFIDSFSAAFRSILFITIPMSVGMIVLSKPLIEVVYQHGQFTSIDTLETIPSLIFLALGLVGQSAIIFLPRTFYALQNTWAPVLMSVVGLVLNVVLMYLLVGPLNQGGVALAWSISGTINMLLLMYVLRRRVGNLDGRRMLNSFARITFSSLVMGLGIFLVQNLLLSVLTPGKFTSLIILGVGFVVGCGVFAGLALLLKMPEVQFVARIVSKRR